MDKKGLAMGHKSVMLEETLSLFEGREMGSFFDGTLGAGGFAEALLEQHPEINCYIGCDRDSSALEMASQRLHRYRDRLRMVHGNFRNLSTILDQQEVGEVDGFFLILGCHPCNWISQKEDLVFNRKGL